MADLAFYPKAKYRQAEEGKGDQIGSFSGGRYSYISTVVLDAKDEEALGPEWHDRPDMTDKPKPEPPEPPLIVEVRRGPGRPRKFEVVEPPEE